MQTTMLGYTGLRISSLCLGAMTFGTDWGWGADEQTSRQLLDTYLDAGGNFIDTADAYTGGTSEEYLGRFLEGRRDEIVLATKYTMGTPPGDRNADGNGAKNLRRSLEASLRRLRTDHIDLYWVHMWDALTPIEETLRALDDAVRAGKVLHIGFSDFPAWLVARADAIANLRGWTRPAAVQLEYNLAQREVERELLPMAEHLGLGVLDWSPLGGGALTGKLLDRAPDASSVRADHVAHFDGYRTDRVETIVRELVAVASELDVTPAQLAIAWLRHRSPLHVPIIGARSLEHLEDNLKAADLALDAETMGRLDDASAIELGFPMDFYRQGRSDWFGAHLDDLDPRIRPLARQTLGLDASVASREVSA